MICIYFLCFLLSVSLSRAETKVGIQEIAANSSVAWQFMAGTVRIGYIVNVTSAWANNSILAERSVTPSSAGAEPRKHADLYVLDSINYARSLAGENFTYYASVSTLDFIWAYQYPRLVNVDTQETFVQIKSNNHQSPITISYNITVINTEEDTTSLKVLPWSIVAAIAITAVFIIIAATIFLLKRHQRLMHSGYHYIG